MAGEPSMVLDLSDHKRAVAEMIRVTPSLVGRALYTSVMKEIVPEVKSNLKKNESIFRGTLFQRIRAEIDLSDPMAPAVRVGAFDVPYAMEVETGSKPHEEDFDKILEYVRKKMRVKPKALRGFRTKGGKYTLDARIAAGIVKSIKEKGTIPHPFLIPAFEAKKAATVADFINRLRGGKK